MKDKNKDIHERIYEFVISVLRFIRKVPRTPENLIIISQRSRSVTSVGANDQEADGTNTKKDLNPKIARDGRVLQDEGIEISKIVSTIIYKTSNK